MTSPQHVNLPLLRVASPPSVQSYAHPLQCNLMHVLFSAISCTSSSPTPLPPHVCPLHLMPALLTPVRWEPAQDHAVRVLLPGQHLPLQYQHKCKPGRRRCAIDWGGAVSVFLARYLSPLEWPPYLGEAVVLHPEHFQGQGRGALSSRESIKDFSQFLDLCAENMLQCSAHALHSFVSTHSVCV